MMLSLTGEYALRAMVYLAKHSEEWPIPGRRIAAGARVPRKYLSKILADLVHAGLLVGTRGKAGGFRMARLPQQITLAEILVPFEKAGPARCPFGNVQCSDHNPCLGHNGWIQVLDGYRRFLAKTSLRDVAGSRDSKSLRVRR